MGFKNGEFSFHVWFKDPKTNVRKWCGQFYDAESALTWKKKQENPDAYTINNIGPHTVAKQAPPSAASKRMQQARAETQARHIERQREAAKEERERAERRAKDAEDTKALREQAEGLLEKHKADEQADLDKGINR